MSSKIKMLNVLQDDGRMTSYPPQELWDKWTEYESRAWPKKVEKTYKLIPTVCFNCESACGLLAYVDTKNYEIRKFEGNPLHPGSRGRNCAKGPATHNQVYDPERILYPLKRVGKRGEGKWMRISWDQALEEIGTKMRESRQKRRDGIMYHVGRPGEDHYANRCIVAWGVDGHNSHTNVCSANARLGYYLWSGFDRPSPDHAHAKVILLISAHLESGHYFNPHAQRIMEGKMKGAKIITLDPRLSNTASKSDLWLSTWPGSEPVLLLAIANYLIQNGLYDKSFVEKWVNWQDSLTFFLDKGDKLADTDDLKGLRKSWQEQREEKGKENWAFEFSHFETFLKILYQDFTLERAAKEAQIPLASVVEAAKIISESEGRLAAHTWRSASIGNLGGWQVARCLFFLNVLTGSVGTKGGTSGNSWNKFTPKPFKSPPQLDCWNELHLPHEWPFAHYEMSFLLPHFLEEGRGDIDVYFTRVYNPLWTNPDGFSWMRVLKDEEKMKCTVAMTPTWNESAWFSDYVLPMGHGGERHDLMSQETHSGQWVSFRQPVQRVARERDGEKIKFTYEANPGEVWEENEFWVEVSGRMDPDGSMGIREHFESIEKPGELVSQDEYWGWIFNNSIPGLPEAAKEKGMTPLEYMKKIGAFEIKKDNYKPYEKDGFKTPSKKLEFFSQTVNDWGWPEKEYIVPWNLKSHVHPDHIKREKGEMLLLPNFRLPTLIHSRSANAKWLYEISHRNPVWIHPEDADRLGIQSGDLLKVETEIGHFVDKAWVTEGIKPGVVACSHHLGRWRLTESENIGKGMANLVELKEDEKGHHRLKVKEQGGPWKSSDPDTERIWWKEVGVHQNLTHGVHPDPHSGAHCWLQRAVSVEKAGPNDHYGDVFVDSEKSKQVYKEWCNLTRSAKDHSPDGTRRPLWFKRPLKPKESAYSL